MCALKKKVKEEAPTALRRLEPGKAEHYIGSAAEPLIRRSGAKTIVRNVGTWGSILPLLTRKENCESQFQKVLMSQFFSSPALWFFNFE